jgi:predicted acyltransferase (DUF342 family)
MKMKDTSVGIPKRVMVISIALLMLVLIILPTPDSVVTGTATVNMELKAGWNLKGMPESISASDLAQKSNYITSVVHLMSDGYYVSYLTSLGVTDFTLEVNEGVYIYSEADTTLLFTINPSNGYLGGDLTVTGDLDITGNSVIDNDLTVLGNLSIIGDFIVNNLNVTEDLTVDGNLKANEDLTVEKDLTIDGNLDVGQDLTAGNLTITEDMIVNDDISVIGDATIDGDSTVVGDMEVLGQLTAGDFTVSDLTISEDLAINGNLSVAGDATIGGDSTVAGDMEILGQLTAGEITVSNLKITEDLTVNGDLTVDKNVQIGGNIMVTGDAIIVGTLTAGNFTVGNLTISEDLAINGDLTITGDATIGGNLSVTDDITINGNYTVTEDLTVGGDLFVTGNITGLALGDMANYVIGRDATGIIYARNGATGDIDFQSTNASYVIQSAIDAVEAGPRDSGMVYIKKADYRDLYFIPSQYTVLVDYNIDTTIQVYDGISIISDGALLRVTSLNATVLELNPDGEDYGSNHPQWKISGIVFVGHHDNTKTTAIHMYNWQNEMVIDNINTRQVATAVKVEGTAYRTVIQNSHFAYGAVPWTGNGETAVRVFQGRGSYAPHATNIINCDISSFKTGIQIDDGYGIRVLNNYFEANDVAVDSSASMVTVIGNYIQPGRGQIGVYAGSGTTTITGNLFMLGGDATDSYGIYAVASTLVSSNSISVDAGDNTFFYSPSQVGATIGDNIYGADGGDPNQNFIDAELMRSLVTNNRISRASIGIRQRRPNPDSRNLYTGNMFWNCIKGVVTGGRDHVRNNEFLWGTLSETDIILNGSNNIVKDNYLGGGTTKIDTSGMGSGNIIEDNIGFVTETSGTTSAGTSIVVTHGLVGTPDQVTVTPLGQTDYYYITGKGPTTFTIVSEANVAFDWYATYKP